MLQLLRLLSEVLFRINSILILEVLEFFLFWAHRLLFSEKAGLLFSAGMSSGAAEGGVLPVCRGRPLPGGTALMGSWQVLCCVWGEKKAFGKSWRWHGLVPAFWLQSTASSVDRLYWGAVCVSMGMSVWNPPLQPAPPWREGSGGPEQCWLSTSTAQMATPLNLIKKRIPFPKIPTCSGSKQAQLIWGLTLPFAFISTKSFIRSMAAVVLN